MTNIAVNTVNIALMIVKILILKKNHILQPKFRVTEKGGRIFRLPLAGQQTYLFGKIKVLMGIFPTFF